METCREPLDPLLGATVNIGCDFCLGDPLGVFCPEDEAELLVVDLSRLEELVVGDAEESMASFVQRAHWKANPLEGFLSMGGLMQSI